MINPRTLATGKKVYDVRVGDGAKRTLDRKKDAEESSTPSTRRKNMTEHPVKVGRVDGTGPVIGFLSITEAERYIGEYVALNNPAGVARGDYYIDAPENFPHGPLVQKSGILHNPGGPPRF